MANIIDEKPRPTLKDRIGKVGDPSAAGDPHQRTGSHGYGYGMRLT